MKYHACIKRNSNTWIVESIDLYGKNIKQFQKQLLPLLTYLEKNQPSVNRKKPSLLEKIKQKEGKIDDPTVF